MYQCIRNKKRLREAEKYAIINMKKLEEEPKKGALKCTPCQGHFKNREQKLSVSEKTPFFTVLCIGD